VGSPGPDAREQLLSGPSSLKKQETTGFRDFDDLSVGTAKEAKGVREAYEVRCNIWPKNFIKA
jgi:hypothetical protein